MFGLSRVHAGDEVGGDGWCGKNVGGRCGGGSGDAASRLDSLIADEVVDFCGISARMG